MADLFEGAPPEWIHAHDDSAHDALNDSVFDWISRKASDTYRKWGDLLYGRNPISYNPAPVDTRPAHERDPLYDPYTGTTRAPGRGLMQSQAYQASQPHMVNGVWYDPQGHWVGGDPTEVLPSRRVLPGYHRKEVGDL